MALVTSSNFSILVNGSPSEIFSPSRGLRHRDPLSPFLFIIMMEGLGRSTNEAKALGNIKGLQLIEQGQTMTHQQIVDDTMLILGFQCDSLPSKYLGIPLTARSLHKSIWELVLNKMQDKVKKWTIRSLNLASRMILTKVVLPSIPIFFLSTLPTPKGVLQQFRYIQRDFLWDKEETRKKWALVPWDKICKPKR
eukprot:PITA_08802